MNAVAGWKTARRVRVPRLDAAERGFAVAD